MFQSNDIVPSINVEKSVDSSKYLYNMDRDDIYKTTIVFRRYDKLTMR